MKESFYEIAEQLDIFKGLENPTNDQIHQVLKYIGEDRYARYFFYDLKNPVWVLPLYENGQFYKVPDPLEDPNNPGYFSMPIWYAGEYLKRMAENYPQIVRSVALSLETENAIAIRSMLEALLKIPPSITAETVIVYKKWTETRFSSFMMLTIEIGKIMEYLAKGKQPYAALTILEILLEPLPSKDPYGEDKIIAGSRHDLYWLNKACQDNLPLLTEIEPISVCAIATKQLIKAINLEYDPKFKEEDKKLKSYWRLSITPGSDQNYDRDLKNLLSNIVILALSKACEQKITEARAMIDNYLYSDYSIFRRVALYILRHWGDNYLDLVETGYLSTLVKPISAGTWETRKFIEAQYRNLPTYLQKMEIGHAYIIPELERMEAIIEERSAAFEGNTKDEKRKSYIEKWQLNELNRYKAYLEGKDQEYYTVLVNKYKEPLPIPEEGVQITSWEGLESPIVLEKLGEKDIEDVVRYLLEFVPPAGHLFGVPSREGLARVLETDVEARPQDYSKKALLFINEKLPFVYHTYYLRGLEEATKHQIRFPLSNVMTLCEYISDIESDEFVKQELELGLPAAKMAITNLIEELLKIRDPILEEDQLERSGSIIVKLLRQDDPLLDHEDSSDFDPAMRSLNSIRGMAMHCIILFGLYCERKRRKQNGENGKSVMVPLVKETLSEKLDKSRNPSPTIHSVFGWYFPQLVYLDSEWALENKKRIFPVEHEMAQYWNAAWSAYVEFSDVFTNVFPELIFAYRKALEELGGEEKKRKPTRLNQQIATHILKSYLLDMITLESEDGLIPLYYQKADEETRSQGVFWLSQVLDAQKPSSQDTVWKKIYRLWQWRLDNATQASDRNIYYKEIPNFCRLLRNAPLELPSLYPLLQQMLEFKVVGYEIQLILDYLGRNCEKHNRLAVLLFYQIVKSGKSVYLAGDTKNSINKILTSAIQADGETKDRVIQIINIFGEDGDYEWRPLLNRLKA